MQHLGRITLLFSIVILFLSCSSNDVSGTGSSTGNAKILGTIVDAQGNGVPSVEVKILESTFDPLRDGSSDTLQSTTDKNGNYSISMDDDNYLTKQFTVLAYRNYDKSFFIKQNVTIQKNNQTSVTGTLKPAGKVKFVLKESVTIKNHYVYIPGTPFYHDLDQGVDNVQGKWIFILKDAAAGKYSQVNIRAKGSSVVDQIIPEFEIIPDETVTVGDSTITTITGRVYLSDGDKAQKAIVQLIPQEYNNLTMDTLPSHLKTESDSEGKFSLTLIETGKNYSISVGSADGKEFWYDHSPDLEETQKIRLKSNGYIRVVFPRTPSINGVSFELLGTFYSTKLESLAVYNKFTHSYVILPVSAGNYGKCTINNNDMKTTLSSSFEIKENDTTSFSWGNLDSVQLFNTIPNVGTNKFYAVAYDKKNDLLYAGSAGGWLVKYDGITWSVVKKLPASIKSIAMAEDKIFVGMDNGIAIVEKQKIILIDHIPVNGKIAPLGVVSSIVMDKHNNSWFGLRHISLKERVFGVAQYSNGLWRVWNNQVEHNFPANHTFKIALDSDNNKWCATVNGIVSFDPDNNKVSHYTTKDYLVNDTTVYAIAVDTIHNRVWAGFGNGKIVQYDRSSGWVSYSPNFINPLLSIGATEVDHYGNVWFGAALMNVPLSDQDKEGALMVYRNGQLRKVDEFQSIYGGVHSIAFDAYNNVWVTTARGGMFTIKGFDN